jgi:hypothetical protein
MSLLEVRLETGRKHQIRVQLAAVGHPVAGDERYGRSGDRRSVDAGRGPARLCLHAAAIELRLPGARESIRIESPAPPEFAAALRGRPGARATAPSEARRVEGRGGAYASRSASRSASRNAAPRGRASPRSRKPSSRI